MRLEGSCHCRAVTFTVDSPHPYPFNLCYCEICRKTAGAGGFAINISARAETLAVTGAAHIRTYRARLRDESGADIGESEGERKFCAVCGSQLWVWDPRWPDLLHPHASAIDTPLPEPPERTHLMLAYRPGWVPFDPGPRDRSHEGYPGESIADWHARLGLDS